MGVSFKKDCFVCFITSTFLLYQHRKLTYIICRGVGTVGAVGARAPALFKKPYYKNPFFAIFWKHCISVCTRSFNFVPTALIICIILYSLKVDFFSLSAFMQTAAAVRVATDSLHLNWAIMVNVWFFLSDVTTILATVLFKIHLDHLCIIVHLQKSPNKFALKTGWRLDLKSKSNSKNELKKWTWKSNSKSCSKSNSKSKSKSNSKSYSKSYSKLNSEIELENRTRKSNSKTNSKNKLENRTWTRKLNSKNDLEKRPRKTNSKNELEKRTRKSNSEIELEKRARKTNSKNEFGNRTQKSNSKIELENRTRKTNSKNELEKRTRNRTWNRTRKTQKTQIQKTRKQKRR